jgi:MAF protein
VIPAEVDERPLPGEQPKDYVLRLAESKARATALHAPQGAIVIAADTTVVDGADILGKPADNREAEAMLRRLRGRSHQVYTALAVLRTADGSLLTDWCRTEVPMRTYSDKEMLAYIATGDPLDKAGAYAIQHDGFQPVAHLWGCYANVMGLPLCHLTRTLVQLGVHPETEIPQACQAALEYACPVYQQVLRGENQS